MPSEEQDSQLQTLYNMHTQITMHINQDTPSRQTKRTQESIYK